MRVDILGPMTVVDTPAPAPAGEVAQRVLAVLVAEANRPLHPDRLADLVWPGDRRTDANALQAHISRWRKALGAHRITYSPAGYTLVLGPGEVDAFEFESLARAAAAARDASDLAGSIELYGRSLALWRGRPFANLTDGDCVRERAEELQAAFEAVRLAHLETLCESGAHDTVLPEAERAARAHPWNEPVHRVLSRAHYGRGDQVAALRVLSDLEHRLQSDLGLDLGVAAQRLRQQILRHEPALDFLDGPRRGTPAAFPTRLGERIETLPTETRSLVHAAALGGLEVDTAHLGRVLGWDGPRLAAALAPALAAGMLDRTDQGLRFPTDGIRDAAAAAVPPAVGLDLHRRLGEDLLDQGSGPDLLTRAADHLAYAAVLDPDLASRAVDLDRGLAQVALAQGRHDDAVRLARRALLSARHAAPGLRAGTATLHLLLGDALHRSGDFEAAMSAYRTAAHAPGADADALVRAALAHEESSLHARRHRTGAHDPSIELLERALHAVDAEDPGRVELLAALAQALTFSGLGERAAELADQAVTRARHGADAEVRARTLLRALAAQEVDRDPEHRFELAREAAAVSRSADADELELEALCAWVPELMRTGRLSDAEQLVSRVEHLAELQGNVLHRYKVPMWRAATALAAGRHDEAEVLIEDFRQAGTADDYDDAPRVHGFQSMLLALGRRDLDAALMVLDGFADDVAFEPWQAARLLVAHAREDRDEVRRLLVPWSARRFALSRPFAGVQTFCACLVAEVVAAHGDDVARRRLAERVAPGVGHRQVLGAGAALLGDATEALGLLQKGGRG